MRNILLVVFVLAAMSARAQEEYKLFDYYEGYVIHKDGNKERGYIQYLDESDRYEKVVFKKELNGKKEKLKPKDIAGYKVADKIYHTVEFKSIPFKNTKFLVLEKDGCLKQYYYRSLSEGAWSTTVILKNDEQAVNTQTFILGFADKMADMVKNNEELAQKIRNKEKGYSLIHLEAIVDEYNANCKS